MAEDKLSHLESKVQTGKFPFFYGYVVVACSFFVLLVTFGTNYSFGIFLTGYWMIWVGAGR
jgi:hypothetical protein